MLGKLRLDYEDLAKKIDEQGKLRDQAKSEEERVRPESEVAMLKGRQRYIAALLKIKEGGEGRA